MGAGESAMSAGQNRKELAMSSSTLSAPRRSHGAYVLVFVVGLVVGLLAGEFVRSPRAQAQIPDAALQRQQTQQQVAETNRLLKEVVDVLRTETLKVRIVEPGKPGPTPGSRTPPAR